MLFLVGNKQDLEVDREVTKGMAYAFAKENGIKYCTETSAKSGINVNQLFFDAAKFLYNQMRSQDMASDSQSSYSGSQSRSNYEVSPFGSRRPSANFHTPHGEKFDDSRLNLQDETLNFKISKRKDKCKC